MLALGVGRKCRLGFCSGIGYDYPFAECLESSAMLVNPSGVSVDMVCPFCLVLRKKESFSSCARRSLFWFKQMTLAG